MDTLNEQIENRRQFVVAGHNLHSVYLYHKSETFKRFYDGADLVLADGMPLLLDYRFSGGRKHNHRIGSTDWLPRLGELRGLRTIVVVGSDVDSNSRFVDYLIKLLPKAEICGMPGASWNLSKAQAALELVVNRNPQLVLIGLGMPEQELFSGMLKSANVSIIATVGGAIDQLGGTQNNAPRWIGRIGMEWVWRLSTQPKRLWKRYLVEPWQLFGMRLKSMFKSLTNGVRNI